MNAPDSSNYTKFVHSEFIAYELYNILWSKALLAQIYYYHVFFQYTNKSEFLFQNIPVQNSDAYRKEFL